MKTDRWVVTVRFGGAQSHTPDSTTEAETFNLDITNDDPIEAIMGALGEWSSEHSQDWVLIHQITATDRDRNESWVSCLTPPQSLSDMMADGDTIQGVGGIESTVEKSLETQ